MKCQRPFDHGNFASAALFVDSRPQPGHQIDRLASHDRRNRRTRRRIADTHFAGADETDTLPNRIGSQFDAGHERAFRCRSIHGGAMQHVSRAHHQFAVDEPRDRSKLMGDTDIDHGDLDPGMAGQHVDSSSAAKKVANHLNGHFARIGADAFVDDTMIGGKCEHPTARDGRL